MISKASVADELAFSALPIETQEMVKRLYGTLKNEYTDQDMITAYEQGWEDGIASIRENNASANNFLKHYNSRKRINEL
jgi:hypothetical protein